MWSQPHGHFVVKFRPGSAAARVPGDRSVREPVWTFANLHASDATRASDLEGPLVEGLCLSVGTDKCGTGETLLRTRDAGFGGSSESGCTLGMLLYTAAAFNSIFKGSNCVHR